MFDLINGLPVHPLVVHAVVVLLPLACLGTIAIAIRPVWRQRYGILVVVAAAVSTALIPVATSSGEALEKHVGNPGEHAKLGGELIWFAVPLLVLSLTLVWLDRHHDTSRPAIEAAAAGAATILRTQGRARVRVVAALAIVAALAASVQVYRVGDSGARAAWGDQVAPHS